MPPCSQRRAFLPGFFFSGSSPSFPGSSTASSSAIAFSICPPMYQLRIPRARSSRRQPRPAKL